MSKTVLVSGGAGFIGSHLVEALLRNKMKVIVVDNMNDFYDPAVKRENLSCIAKAVPDESADNFVFIEKDVSQLSVSHIAEHTTSLDAVIHMAAIAGVRPSIESPFVYEKNNTLGTLALLELTRLLGVRKFILASSSSVYGVNPNVPWSESDPLLLPISPYAASKIAAEAYCQVYSRLYHIGCVLLRLFTVYGPRQRPDLAISKFIAKAYREEVIDIYGDGSSSRDYTFVGDIVNGIIAALEKDIRGAEIFNLGSNSPTSLLSLLDTIENAVEKKLKINHLPLQQGDVFTTFADIEKARSVLGYEPRMAFDKGVHLQVQSFLNSR